MRYFLILFSFLLHFCCDGVYAQQGVSAQYLRLYPTSLPSTCHQGDIRFDAVTNFTQVCNGSNQWNYLGLFNETAYTVLGNNTASAALPTSINSIFLGTPSITDTGVAAQYTGSVSGYYQTIIQNTSGASNASADVIVNNNQGTSTTHYGDFGINSSAFTGSGSLALPGATYLYSQSGDLVVGSNTSNAVHFLANNSTTDAFQINTSNQFVFPSFTTAGVLKNDTSGIVTSTAGPLGVTLGGTGIASATAYAPILGGTTSTGAFQSASFGLSNVGYVLTSTGTGSSPTWQIVTPSFSGLTPWGVVYANTATTQLTTAAGTQNQYLQANGSASPTWQSFSAPTVSTAYSAGIGTGGFAVSPSNYGYVFAITSASAVANDVYQNSATVTITIASPAVITAPVAHNLVIGAPVKFSNSGGALPTGLTAGTQYYVSDVPSTTTFKVSLYPDGPNINTTGSQSGTQTMTDGNFTISSSTSSLISVISNSPTLASGVLPWSEGAGTGNTLAAVMPVAPPVSGTLSRVSGTGPSTLTFTSANYYNLGYYGTRFTITAGNATAAAVYQDQRTFTVTIASPGVFTTSVAHGLIIGQGIQFTTTGALPTGLTASTEYFVSAIPSITTFQVSATQGGVSVNTTGTQSGTHTMDGAEFTVASTIATFTDLYTSALPWGASKPLSQSFQPGVSGSLVKLSGTGDSTITYSAATPLATYTVPTSPRQPVGIDCKMTGGGAGGAGGGASSTAGAVGLPSSFGNLFLAASGGTNGTQNSGGGGGFFFYLTPYAGSASVTIEDGTAIGGGGGATSSGNSTQGGGGAAGASCFGGAGKSSAGGGTADMNAFPNTGSGGGGAASGINLPGGGGGAGGCIHWLIAQANLSSTYTYSVGLGGNGGNGAATAGGAGATAGMICKEAYQ